MIISSVASHEESPVPVGPGLRLEPLADRLAHTKRAYTTHRADLGLATTLIVGGRKPAAGDLLLARVTRLGQHTGLQLTCGRRARLFPGDGIIACYGNRYAPDQFEAVVPDHLGPCHLVAGGGIAARARSWHTRMRRPTEIEPLGILADAAGSALNVARFRLPEEAVSLAGVTQVVAVAGTSMNAGKTTAAAHLIRGLAAAGLQVGAAKVTGTGASGDIHLMLDAGAHQVVDFTDFGYASTYRVTPSRIESILQQAIGCLSAGGAQAIVIEIADGLYQAETAALLTSATFRRLVSGIVFAAPDAMGAASGVEWLEQRSLPVLAVSGCLTASPLAVSETAEATSLPVLGPDELQEASHASQLLGALQARYSTAGAGP